MREALRRLGGPTEGMRNRLGRARAGCLLPLPAEASGVGWQCLSNGGRGSTFEDSLKGQLDIGGIQGRGLQEEQPIVF